AVVGSRLRKLEPGSWGTRAAMTEVTSKTQPMPETEQTVLIRVPAAAEAIAAMTGAMGSPCAVSGAAFLPAGFAASILSGEIAVSGGAVAALRLEGFSPS